MRVCFNQKLMVALLAISALWRFCGAGLFVEGRVYSEAGSPLAGASVCIGETDTAFTDTTGRFVVHSSPTGIPDRKAARGSFVALTPRGLVVRNMRAQELHVAILTASGRTVCEVYDGVVESDRLLVDVARVSLADGFYIWRISTESRVFSLRAAQAGKRLVTDTRRLLTARGALAKQTASPRSIVVNYAGYESFVGECAADTVLGMRITLYRSGRQPTDRVNYTMSEKIIGSSAFCVDHEASTYSWIGDRIKAYNNGCLEYEAKRVNYTLITISNGLIEVDVAPQLGLRVLAARDVIDPEEPIDFFASHSPRLSNSWLKGHGGVEPSFPFFESGTSTADQEGGYRVIEHADGAVTVAMNMRMDHRQTEMDMGFLGKYGDRPLSAWVTVRPGSNMFEITYRAENHNPVRRSNRLWNNTFFPRKGLYDSLLFPVYYAADHCLKSTWTVNGNPTREHASHFGLFPQYPFSGCWYVSESVNRLRIADPDRAPGMKLYDQGLSYFEIWGSTNAVFEVPEGFVREYEPLEMTHKYYVTRGIGKVAYANEHVAIALRSPTRFAMVATRPGRASVRNLDGAVIIDDAPIGPTAKITGEFQEGVEAIIDGEVVFCGQLPILLDDSDENLSSLRAIAKLSWGDGGHRANELATLEGFTYATNVELEDLGSKWWTLSGMAAAFFDFTKAQNPAVSIDQCISLANACYKLGRLDLARVYTHMIDFKGGHPACDYLKGLIAWEKGETVDFGDAGILAQYHRALQAIAANDHSGAQALLEEYVQTYPRSFRPRLALAYLRRDLSLAAQCVSENPGSPEALWVLAELGYGPAARELQTLVDTATGSDIALDNFVNEVTRGTWRHGRRYEHTHAALAERFPFPDDLRY